MSTSAPLKKVSNEYLPKAGSIQILVKSQVLRQQLLDNRTDSAT